MNYYEEHDHFVKSLSTSLNHCQYENLGMPFDRVEQFILKSNNQLAKHLETTKAYIRIIRKDAIIHFVNRTYEKVCRFGVLFRMLTIDYKNKKNGGRSRLTRDTYKLVRWYLKEIRHFCSSVRNLLTKRSRKSLIPFHKLTLDSFNIHGHFIAT